MNYHATSNIDDCRIIELPRRVGDNGCLTEVENTEAFPFKIKRVYYLYDLPADSERGGHSHRNTESLLVAVSGSFDVHLSDGVREKTVTLNRPYQGLHLTKGIWRRLDNFSSGSVCLVLTSDVFEEEDYVREYTEFQRLTAEKRKEEASPKFGFLDLGLVNAPYKSQLKAAACRVIDSGCYIGGEEVKLLENDIAALCQTQHAVGVSNGLDALRLIFRAYIEMGRLQPGDEVIVPADTFIASALAITDNGLVPVFADPSLLTYNLDAAGIEAVITERTKAVLLVHLYGRVCWSQEIAAIAQKHNLLIIEDNAQALGAVSPIPGINGTCPTGSLGHAAGVSFYPTKNVGALGDAGIVTTNDEELARMVRMLGNYGGDGHYRYPYAGLNCRLDPLQAALIRVKLPWLGSENEHRQRLATIYNTEIKNEHVALPYSSEEMAPNECVYHQYVVRVKERDEFRQYLSEHGVETGVHYPVPLHQQPCYAMLAQCHLPHAEEICSQAVSLPISSGTTLEDARQIARIINGYATR